MRKELPTFSETGLGKIYTESCYIPEKDQNKYIVENLSHRDSWA